MDVLGRTFAQLTVTKRHGKASERRTCELSGRFSTARSKSFPSDELGNVRDRKKGWRTEEGEREKETRRAVRVHTISTSYSRLSSIIRV